jgi:hypothetical protein
MVTHEGTVRRHGNITLEIDELAPDELRGLGMLPG